MGDTIVTSYTFVPRVNGYFVNWDDPTVWSGMVVPNAADADVIFPLATTSSGSVFRADIDINPGESFVTRSVTDMDGNLNVNGSLSVSGELSLSAGSYIELGSTNASLSFGSLTNAGAISGTGQITTPGTFVNTPGDRRHQPHDHRGQPAQPGQPGRRRRQR